MMKSAPSLRSLKNQAMAWNPRGYLVLASGCGTMAEQGPPRYLLAMHPEGGAPEGVSYAGPRFRKGVKGMLGGEGEASVDFLDHVAVSPDGQWVYMTNYSSNRGFRQRHGVYRVMWTDQEAAKLFLDWGMSRRGQTVWQDEKILLYPSLRSDATPLPTGKRLQDFKLLFPSDWADYNAAQNEFVKEWNGIMGL
jgi:hypothetical protein